jgi:hypothetical protein
MNTTTGWFVAEPVCATFQDNWTDLVEGCHSSGSFKHFAIQLFAAGTVHACQLT